MTSERDTRPIYELKDKVKTKDGYEIEMTH